VVARLGGRRLPPDPRQRWAYPHLHVNEQTPRQLKWILMNTQFESHVWLENLQEFGHEDNPILKAVMIRAASWPLIKTIFCNDILAIARKPVAVTS
jgi:hypothetical protein